jgi:hypothetical protein
MMSWKELMGVTPPQSEQVIEKQGLPFWEILQEAVIESGALDSIQCRSAYKYGALVMYLQLLEEDEGFDAARSYFDKYCADGLLG